MRAGRLDCLAVLLTAHGAGRNDASGLTAGRLGLLGLVVMSNLVSRSGLLLFADGTCIKIAAFRLTGGGFHRLGKLEVVSAGCPDGLTVLLAAHGAGRNNASVLAAGRLGLLGHVIVLAGCRNCFRLRLAAYRTLQ